MLPLDQYVADYVHACTCSDVGGQSSRRVKDLIDLVLISSLFAFQPCRLRQAFEATISACGTYALPTALSSHLPQWRTACRRMAAEVDLAPDMFVGYERARVFINLVLDAALLDSYLETTWQLLPNDCLRLVRALAGSLTLATRTLANAD